MLSVDATPTNAEIVLFYSCKRDKVEHMGSLIAVYLLYGNNKEKAISMCHTMGVVTSAIVCLSQSSFLFCGVEFKPAGLGSFWKAVVGLSCKEQELFRSRASRMQSSCFLNEQLFAHSVDPQAIRRCHSYPVSLPSLERYKAR